MYMYDHQLSGPQYRRKEQPITLPPSQHDYYPEPIQVMNGNLGQAVCPGYERGEKQKSHTSGGHLASDVILLNGRLLIADFGVDWRSVKESTKKERLLREWLARFETDPSYQLRIIGYSDCVGNERNNQFLRRGRAERVYQLLGKRARSRVVFKGAAPLETYVADNGTIEGRAKNRSVVIEFQQSISIPPEEITAKPLCEIKTLKIWLNAFIPRDVKGLTREVPATIDRSMAGKTMFDTLFGCGLTDQRGFSSDIKAPSRMHSEVEIDLGALTWKQHHRTDPSIQVDCALGYVKCNRQSDTSPMKFSDFRVTPARNQFTIKLKGSQGAACPIFAKAITSVGNKIDYNGGFLIERRAPNVVRISFMGYLDLFPAYEMWATVNRSNPVPLYGTLPHPGSSPITHLDTPQKTHYEREITLTCKNGKDYASVFKLVR